MGRRSAAAWIACLLALGACGGIGTDTGADVLASTPAPHRFVNPIVAAQAPGGSADPSVVFRAGRYHYCRSLAGGAIGVAVAARLQDIGSAPMTVVWTPPPGTAWSRQVWAPELSHLQGRWYIHFAASDGDNANHRMFVLEGDADDPQKGYAFKGEVAAPDGGWAIDGVTLEHAGRLYFVWSGWRHAGDGFPQVLYIAPMSNPWTISGPRHEIAAPDRAWERRGAPLLEGPAVLRHGTRLFIAYSASASWTDDYAIGLLTHSGGDILSASSWVKAEAPVLSKRTAPGDRGTTPSSSRRTAPRTGSSITRSTAAAAAGPGAACGPSASTGTPTARRSSVCRSRPVCRSPNRRGTRPLRRGSDGRRNRLSRSRGTARDRRG